MTQPWDIEGFLEIRNDQLHIDGVSAPELAREHGTPLFVISEQRIRHNIDRIKRAGNVIPMPLKVCYAAKAMSTMGVLGSVKDAGCDIEVNAGGELWKALEVGFRAEQIIFNGTSKEIWELDMAINAGIYAIQVDSLYELSLIVETAKRLRKRANVSLRLVPEIETETHSGLQTALLTSKFGMMPDEAQTAFREHKDSPHLDLCGIHLHVGSQNPDAAVYAEALQVLFENVDRIYDGSGVKLRHVNLGGGFPVNYLRGSAPDIPWPEGQRQQFEAGFNPDDAIHDAWLSIRSHPKFQNTLSLFDDLTLLLEPGRSIIADAGICLTTVRNFKKRPVDGSSIGADQKQSAVDTWLLTDAGFNILLSMETYKWYYHLVSADRAADEHSFPYKLAGPLCDGGDVYFDIEGESRLPEYRMLPNGLVPGNLLALLNCGAYSLAQASQYNGRFLPAVVLIREGGVAELIRKRDDFADLVNNDIW